jgi:hypothetical protein
VELFQLETGLDKEVRFAVKIVEHDKTYGHFGSDVWIVQVGIGIDLGVVMEKVNSKLGSIEGADWMRATSVSLLLSP